MCLLFAKDKQRGKKHFLLTWFRSKWSKTLARNLTVENKVLFRQTFYIVESKRRIHGKQMTAWNCVENFTSLSHHSKRQLISLLPTTKSSTSSFEEFSPQKFTYSDSIQSKMIDIHLKTSLFGWFVYLVTVGWPQKYIFLIPRWEYRVV